MVVRLFFLLAVLFSLLLPGEAGAEAVLRAAFPYHMTAGEKAVPAGSSQLLFVDVQNFNNDAEEQVVAEITLPDGFSAESSPDWTVEGNRISLSFTLPAEYGESFRAIPVRAADTVAEGSYEIPVTLTGEGWKKETTISFTTAPAEATPQQHQKKAHETWYIQSVVLPVDENGNQDARGEKDTMVAPDVTLENMKNRLTGGSGVDWTSILSKPNAYLLLDLRNPKQDSRTLHFTAELVDRETGAVLPGLIPAPDESGGQDTSVHATEAALSLNGQKMESAVVPLYVDPFAVTGGDYNLHITLSDGSTNKVTEVPVTVVKKRSVGMVTLGFAIACLVILLLSIPFLKKSIVKIGARGDIAVALFAALAFGGVVVPVTLLGDFLHVILGPFSGFVTGLLSGVVQYLLLVSLLILFRRPGVAALFFLIRWLLSAVLFGRVTPVGILLCAVSVVIIEAALRLSGFYRKKSISMPYAVAISFLMGICDAGITFVNMQQMMFFYRLYYADWFIALYMVINGLLYSTAGSFMGFRIGARLRQVMSE